MNARERLRARYMQFYVNSRRTIETISLNIHDFKAAYEKAIGHATSDSTVYNLLHRHGWRNLTPRTHHPKRDLAAQSAFKKSIFLML
jgi:hypothetical protein